MASSADETKKMRDAASDARDNFQAISDILSKNLATTKASADIIDSITKDLKGQISLEDQLSSLELKKNEYLTEYLKTGKIINEDLVKRLDISIDLLRKEAERKTKEKEIKQIQSDLTDELYSGLGVLGDWLKAGTDIAAANILLKGIISGIKSTLDSTLGNVISLRREYGIATSEAAKLQVQNTLLAMTSRFTAEEINNATKAYIDQYDTVIGLTGDLTKSIADISKLTGDASGAAILATEFERASGDSNKLRNDIESLAEKEGVSARKVYQQLVSQSNLLVGASEQQIRNLVEQNIQLAKQGMNMERLTTVADSMLNIETSLKAEAKARALLQDKLTQSQLSGYNDLRQAALEFQQTGDIDSFTKSFNNVNMSAEQFKELGPAGQRIFAESLGMTSDMLADIIRQQETYNKRVDYLGEDGVKMLDSALNVWETIPGGIKDATTALLGYIAQTLILNKLQTGSAGLANLNPFKKTGGGSPISATPTADSGMMSGMTSSIEKIDAKKLLAGGAALVLVAASVFVFAKAVQEFMNVEWGAVGMAVVSMISLVGAVALLGAIMSSGVGAVAVLAGAAAMIVVASAIYILGKAIQEMATGFSMMGDITDKLTALVSIAPGLMSLAAVFGVIGLSFIAFAAGLAYIAPMLPVLLALGMVLPLITSAMSGGNIEAEQNVTTTTESDELLKEIRGLRQDIQTQPIVITVDGKVVQEITKVQSRQKSFRGIYNE